MTRAFSRFLNYLTFVAAMWLLFFAMVALAKITEKPVHPERFKVSLPSSAVAQVATVNAQPPNTSFSAAGLLLAGGAGSGTGKEEIGAPVVAPDTARERQETVSRTEYLAAGKRDSRSGHRNESQIHDLKGWQPVSFVWQPGETGIDFLGGAL